MQICSKKATGALMASGDTNVCTWSTTPIFTDESGETLCTFVQRLPFLFMPSAELRPDKIQLDFVYFCPQDQGQAMGSTSAAASWGHLVI